jgi:putative glycosyltransferase (TIGR04372 family)
MYLRHLSISLVLNHFYRSLIYFPILRFRALCKKSISSAYVANLSKNSDGKIYLLNSKVRMYIFHGLLENSSEKLHNGLFFESKRLSEYAFELKEESRLRTEDLLDQFHPEFYGAIGHIASGIGMYAKLIVNGYPMKTIDPIARQGTKVANNELVNLLAEQFKLPLKNITTKREAFWHSTARLNLWTLEDQPLPFYWATAELEKNLNAELEKPLLLPKLSWFEFAIRDLARFGFSAKDWFVGLHIREVPRDLGARVLVQDYIPLIKEITSAGGWVLRIGSPTAQPLPAMPNVIDLSQPSLCNSQNHMFALSFARTFVGSQSGPLSVPALFGVPTLWTNAVGLGIMPYLNHVLALPMRFVDEKGILVNLERHALSKWALLDRNPESVSKLESWKPLKNSSQDILDAYKLLSDNSRVIKNHIGQDFAAARAQVCPYPAPDSLWIG